MTVAAKIDRRKLAAVKKRGLDAGSHAGDPKTGHCVMEAFALVRGLPFGDKAPCVSPAIRSMLIRLNDSPVFSEYRNELIAYIERIVDTKGTDAQERRRAYMCADWAVRVIAPMALEKRFPDHAKALRACAEIVDVATAEAGRKVARSAANAADAANAAANAAYAYAADAATYATYAANAAYAAANAANAADAATYAANAADDAYAANAAARRALWDSALAHLDRLISVTAEVAA